MLPLLLRRMILIPSEPTLLQAITAKYSDFLDKIVKRDFLTFPSKFANVAWEFPPQLWFRTARPLPAGGPSPPPF
jgi:hypothetical protein